MRLSENSRVAEQTRVQTAYADASPSAERRPKRRKPALLPAVAVFSNGESKFDCTIRDITADGARISVPKNTACPSHIFLINVRDRVAFAARVIWNDESEVGLYFVHAIPLADLADPALAFLKKFWLERAVR